MKANSTGGQGSRTAVAPSDDNDDDDIYLLVHIKLLGYGSVKSRNVYKFVLCNEHTLRLSDAYWFLSAFAKLRRATISFVMSPTGQTYMKLNI